MNLNPDFLIGRAEYANFLTAMCRFEEAIEIHRQTVQLAPQDPTILGELAYTLTLSEQYEEALDLFKRTLATDPTSPHINSLVTLLYTMQGDYDSALVYWKNLVDDKDLSDLNTFFLGQGGHMYGRMGQSDTALLYLNELNRKVSEGETVPYSAFAFIYIGLGENDKAISALEKGYDRRDPVLVWLKAHSYYFEPLRSEAGFERLLKKMGFKN